MPKKPLAFLAPTNVDGSTHVKRAQAKVERHENRLGFQLRAVWKCVLSITTMEKGSVVSPAVDYSPSSAPMIPVHQAS